MALNPLNNYEVDKILLKAMAERVPEEYKTKLIDVLISSLAANKTIDIFSFEDSVRWVLDYENSQ